MILTFSFKRSIYNFLKATIKFVLQRRSKRLFTRLLRCVWMLRNHIALVRTLTRTEWTMSTRLKIDDIKRLRLEKFATWETPKPLIYNLRKFLFPSSSSDYITGRWSQGFEWSYIIFWAGAGAGSREGESLGNEAVINPGGQRRQTFS